MNRVQDFLAQITLMITYLAWTEVYFTSKKFIDLWFVFFSILVVMINYISLDEDSFFKKMRCLMFWVSIFFILFLFFTLLVEFDEHVTHNFFWFLGPRTIERIMFFFKQSKILVKIFVCFSLIVVVGLDIYTKKFYSTIIFFLVPRFCWSFYGHDFFWHFVGTFIFAIVIGNFIQMNRK